MPIAKVRGMTDRLSESDRLRRFRAAAALRGMTLAQVATHCAVSDSHLRNVALGLRTPSARLVAAIEQELGRDGWAFSRGLQHTLQEPDVDGGGAIADEATLADTHQVAVQS